jgi:thiol-disulfide isomerase/thioredoxin
MKILFVLSILFVTFSSFAQTTTYSKKEERMVEYVANGWGYAQKYDSVQNVKPVLDSCWKFLKKYPHSFAKPNVFSYMLEMTILISKDTAVINPLIDSVLYYDQLPVTKERIGEILITRNLDVARGRDIIIKILPKLTVPFHKYKAYMLLAKSDITLGYFASAETNFEYALHIDSTRAEGWYEYLGFLKMREMHNSFVKVKNKIEELNEEKQLHYTDYTHSSPNINKNISKIEMKNLDNNNIRFSSMNGKVLVVDRFNFWCGFCAKEFPLLKKIMKEFPQVKFIFVDYGETTQELKGRYFKMKEFSFLKNQIVVFGNKKFNDTIYALGVPQTLVIDKQGTVRFDNMGYNKNLDKLLRNELKFLINE